MVSGAAAGLTRIGFRRDVKLFLTVLVGYLVVLIAALVLILVRTTAFATDATVRQWNTAADAVAEAVAARTANPTELRILLPTLATRYGVDAIEVQTGGGVVQHGLPQNMRALSRPIPGGTLVCYFDPTPIENARRSFMIVATICVVASALGIVLLLLYLPRILRPVELMLEEAAEVRERGEGQDETHYLVETFRDSVATLKAREEELRALHEKQKTRADDLERVTGALTRSLTSGFFSIGAGGQVVAVNSAARETLSLPAVVEGATIEEVFGSDGFGRLVRSAFERRQALARAEATAMRDGERRDIGLTTVPLVNEQQEFLGMLGLFTDLTPIRELEHRVREMQNLADLGEISAGIAHEFRNSLSTIVGYRRLSRRGASVDEAVRSVEKAEREANELAQAVSSLLAFARPMTLEKQPVDLHTLAEAVVERLRVSTDVPIRFQGERSEIEGDARLLDRAVENVVRNALQSVERKNEGGSVEVAVFDGATPSIVVTDEGVGIDEREVPTLFLPFRSSNPDGYGLGLALTRKIVLLHGGAIRLTGEPGKGAKAVLEFRA